MCIPAAHVDDNNRMTSGGAENNAGIRQKGRSSVAETKVHTLNKTKQNACKKKPKASTMCRTDAEGPLASMTSPKAGDSSM
jgi:hypothetical protein